MSRGHTVKVWSSSILLLRDEQACNHMLHIEAHSDRGEMQLWSLYKLQNPKMMADFTLLMVLGLLLLGLITLLVLHSSSQEWQWHGGLKDGVRLPKGSFGWPIIGETIALNRDPLGFAISHQKRYGSIFKSSLFMRKSILGTTPEFAKFVLTNNDLFRSEYPKNVSFLIPKSFFFLDGPPHDAIKKLVSKSTLPESIRTMVETLESITLENLALWEQRGTVLGSEVAEQIVAELATYIALGVTNIRATPEGKSAIDSLNTMIDAMGSAPLNLPGTAHSKGLKAKATLTTYLKTLLKKKQTEVEARSGMLGALVQAQEDSQARGEELQIFSDEALLDDMIAVWVGAFKTTATTVTWSLKFLLDYPDVFKRIQAEQEEILKSKDLSIEGPRLTWEDTKKMVYTAKFFHEVQRTISIAFMLPRTASQDVLYDGFLIPKGWQVLPLVNLIHSNPAYFADPMSFNPDRFDVTPRAYTYMPFAVGPHRCPGEEIAKMFTLINIHHLTTTYTYESVGPDLGKEHNGFPMIVGGYPIKVRRRM